MGPKRKAPETLFESRTLSLNSLPRVLLNSNLVPPTEVVNSSRVPQSRTDGPDCRKYARLQTAILGAHSRLFYRSDIVISCESIPPAGEEITLFPLH